MSMTIEELATSGPEHRLLPHGIESFIKYANSSPTIPFEEQNRIFEDVKAATELRELLESSGLGQNIDEPTKAFLEHVDSDKHCLVWSYMPFVVGRAYGMFRKNGPTRLEDYIQSGIEGLYKAVDCYARKDDRWSFVEFSRFYVDDAMRQQRHRDIYSTEIERSMLDVMYGYQKAMREAEESQTEVDIDALRTKYEASQDRMFGALALVATRRGVDDFSLEENDFIQQVAEPETPRLELSPRLSWAMTILAPQLRGYVEQVFGLRNDEPVLTFEEIAVAEGASGVDYVRNKTAEAVRDLRIIMRNFDEYRTNFDQWPETRFAKARNVLTYLHKVGMEIPADKTAQELRVIAMRDLIEREGSARDKSIVADFYGLQTGKMIPTALMEQKYRCTNGRIYQICQKVMAKPEA